MLPRPDAFAVVDWCFGETFSTVINVRPIANDSPITITVTQIQKTKYVCLGYRLGAHITVAAILATATAITIPCSLRSIPPSIIFNFDVARITLKFTSAIITAAYPRSHVSCPNLSASYTRYALLLHCTFRRCELGRPIPAVCQSSCAAARALGWAQLHPSITQVPTLSQRPAPRVAVPFAGAGSVRQKRDGYSGTRR